MNRSNRTAHVVALAIFCVAGVAVLTESATLVGMVAGFAGTALGILAQRHTAADLYASSPASADTPAPVAPPRAVE